MKGLRLIRELTLLLFFALPLVLRADLASPAWEESISMVVIEKPGLIFWYVGITAFVVTLGLTILIGRFARKSITEYVVLEILIGVALVAAVIWIGGVPVYRIRTVHHPSVSPSTHCSDCGTKLRYHRGRYCPRCDPDRETGSCATEISESYKGSANYK